MSQVEFEEQGNNEMLIKRQTSEVAASNVVSKKRAKYIIIITIVLFCISGILVLRILTPRVFTPSRYFSAPVRHPTSILP